MINLRKSYNFTGTHADIVKKLAKDRRANKDENIKYPDYFKYFYQIFLTAPIIGFLYGRKGKKNYENNSEATIFAEQMISQQEEIEYIIKLILMLDKSYLNNQDERIDHLFRYTEFSEEEFEVFEKYLLGGIEVLNEKLIDEAEKNDISYIDALDQFIEEFNNRFNEIGLENQNIIEECNDFKLEE